MPTVKLVTIEGEPRVVTKTIEGEVRVSCSCCLCLCNEVSCSDITAGFRTALSPTTQKPPLPPEENVTIQKFDDELNQIVTAFSGPITYHGQFGEGWATNAGKPAGVSFIKGGSTVWAGWSRKSFCLRFVCREVNDESEDGTVVCSILSCGPTLNEFDMLADLFDRLGARAGKSNLLSTETESGLYIYCFEFFGWRRPQWEPLEATTQSVNRDDAYRIYSFFNTLG